MNYVKEYLRLEKVASTAENTVEEQRTIADSTRYEQCRVSHDATTAGGYTQRQFASSVKVDQTTISRRVRIWAEYGARPLAALPAFGEAWAWSKGTTQADESTRKQISNARAVLRDPKLVRELFNDSRALAVAHGAIQEINRAQPTQRAVAPTGDAAFLRCVDDMLRVEQSLVRLTENLNQGRKNGFLTPAVLREFVEKLRLYADAIEEIAASRGLTDEALAEWIGVED